MSSQCGARRKRGGDLDLAPKLMGYGGRRRSGGGYGFGGVIGTNGADWAPNNTSNVGKPAGGRRKTKKKKAGRRTRRKTRGGGSVATVGYGYVGTGSRGLADPKAYNSNPLPDGGFMSK
jgi:hypothetical protein